MIPFLMPLIPFLIEGAKWVAIGTTIYNAVDTVGNFIEADSVVTDAEAKLSDAKHSLNKAKKNYKKIVTDLIDLRKKSIEKLSEIDVNWSIDPLNDRITNYVNKELNSILDKFNIQIEHRKGIIKVKDVIITGTLGAAAASFTPSVVKCTLEEIAIQIGKTSTGKAISTLSGIAQRNAIYAWLGGGSKAAGGLGVEGGKALIGGLSTASVFSIATSALNILSNQVLNEAKQKAWNIYNQAQEKIIKAELINKETQAKCIGNTHLVKYFNLANQMIYNSPNRAKTILIGIISNLNFLLNFEHFSVYESQFTQEFTNTIENTLRRLSNGY